MGILSDNEASRKTLEGGGGGVRGVRARALGTGGGGAQNGLSEQSFSLTFALSTLLQGMKLSMDVLSIVS